MENGKMLVPLGQDVGGEVVSGDVLGYVPLIAVIGEFWCITRNYSLGLV
jgi:hypothetical protein